MKKRRLIKLMLTLVTAVLSLYLLSLSSSAVVLEGECGEGLTWTFDSESGVLDIKGTGEMTVFQVDDFTAEVPWQRYAKEVKELFIGEGLSYFDAKTFSSLVNCEKVTVHENNPVYMSEENCIIKRDTSTLVFGGLATKIPSYVTTIGEYAFFKSDITTIDIPSNVIKIENSAFLYCRDLKNVSFPDGLMIVENQAFAFCSNLESAKLPDSVTYIGNAAFFFCKALTEFKIPANLTSITQRMLSYTGITDITIPEKVKLIEEGAFSSSSVKNVKILNDDLIFEKEAFYQSSLESINLPANLKVIPTSCFNCCQLKSIVIPESVTRIEKWGFGFCRSLDTVIPKNVSEIDISAFYRTTNAPKVSEDNPYFRSGENCIIDIQNKSLFLGRKGCIIPDDGSVTSIGKEAFMYSDVTEVSLPDSITSIEEKAFYECSELTSVKLSQNLEKIGESAFDSCTELYDINLPDNLKIIEAGAFYCCSAISVVIVPDSIVSIGNSAFSGCSNLMKVILPDHLTEIPNSIFHGCLSLSNVNIPKNVKSIGDSAFAGCRSLRTISLPEGITHIGNKAFEYCTTTQSLYLPTTLKHIGYKAFATMESLEVIEINSCPDFIASDAVQDYKNNPIICINSQEFAEQFNKIPFFNTGVTDNIAIKKSLVNDSVYNNKYLTPEESISYSGEEYYLFRLKNPIKLNHRDSTPVFFDDKEHWPASGPNRESHTFSSLCSARCTECGYENPEPIHVSISYYQENENVHVTKCDHCHKESSAPHVWDEGRMVEVTVQGQLWVGHYLETTCVDCKYTKKELIEVTYLDPTPTPTPTPDETEVTELPSTPEVTPSVTPPEETTDPPVDITEPQDQTLTIILISVSVVLLVIATLLVLPLLKNKKKK